MQTQDYHAAGALDPEEIATLKAMHADQSSTFEAYAVAIILLFGAVIVSALVAGSLVYNDRTGFFTAVGAYMAAWLGGHALLLDRPRIFAVFEVLALALSVASVVAIAT